MACSSSSASKSSCSGSPSSPYVRIPNAATIATTASSSPASHHNHHHSHSHHSHARSQSHSHRHYHMPPAAAATTAAADSFDDSSSSLSSTPSSATIVTSSSSSTSEELIPGRLEISAAAAAAVVQPRINNQDQSSKNRKNSSTKRKGLDCQQMNDLNTGSSNPGSSSSASRRSRKTGNECSAADRNSSPAFHTGDNSWTTFHFGPQNVVTTTTSTRNELNGRLSPRCESEHYASSITALEQRMRTSTLGSGNSCSNSTSNSPSRISNGKAVAVIKGTASSTSRLSSNSFNGSSSDWKKHLHSHEIRKLKRELDQSEEKVSSLTSQLTTHSHMVTAFEQSLASMSLRLQQMTSMSSQKDSEIQRLKSRIEELKIGSGGGGKVGHESRIRTTSGGNSSSSATTATPPCTPSKKSFPHCTCNSKDCDHHSHSRLKSGASTREGKSSSSSLLIRRHTFVSPLNSDQSQQQPEQSVGSVKENSNRWFKAFRRTSSSSKQKSSAIASPASASSDHESGVTGENQHQGFRYSGSRTASIDSFSRIDASASLDPELVTELKRQLREKEKTVTDLRLEALTSAHQLQSLEELVTQLQAEIGNLRVENERLSKSTTQLNGGVNVTHHKVKNGSSGSQASSSGGIEWPTSDEASGYASITSVYFGSNS